MLIKPNNLFKIWFDTNINRVILKMQLSLHCNYERSYLLVNGNKIIKPKVKQTTNKDCLAVGIISPYFNKDEAL